MACAAILALSTSPGAEAEAVSGTVRVRAQTEAAIRLEDGSASLARVSVQPRFQVRSAKGWRAEVSAQLVAAPDETGVGSIRTYSAASRPVELGHDGRIELDRAFVTFGTGDQRLTLGKQSLAWGILDGLQVTDRFDPVNRTEGVFGEIRPQRLARWGVRWQAQVAGTRIDAAAALDPTVSQLPQASGAFAPVAPRLRAGLPGGAATLPLTVAARDEYLKDATLGLRASRTFGRSEASLVLISGPETEPVFEATSTPGGPAIALRYPRRAVIGATLDRADGPRVWRVEAAYIPDQPVNIRTAQPVASESRPRFLAGLGLDWSAPGDVLFNLQLGVDHIDAGDADIVRPETDVIATLRLQRAFRNERFWLKGEILGTLSEGDGAFRPWLEWRQSDDLVISAGADLVWGREQGLFGQYESQSRLWTRVARTF